MGDDLWGDTMMSVLLTSGMTAPPVTKAARVAELRRRWADATRHLRWDEADELWQELMPEWLKPTAVNQRYWNRPTRSANGCA